MTGHARRPDPTDAMRPLSSRLFRALLAAGWVAAALALFAPALGDAQFVYGRDTTGHDYAMHLWGVSESTATGRLPLWCAHVAGGIPTLGSFALAPFHPTHWLYAATATATSVGLPFNTGFTLQYALAVAVAGMAGTWWARALGARRWVAVAAGAWFAGSGHFLTLIHAGHLQKMMAVACAPAALAAAWRLGRGDGRKRAASTVALAVALAFALGMQLLASHPQIWYATVAACVAVVAVRATGPRWRRVSLPAAVGLGAALAGGLALGAVQMLPGLEFSAVSNRGGGVPWAEAVETSYPPGEWLEYIVPGLQGDSVGRGGRPYTGAWGERIVSDYLGLPIAVLAVAGALAGAARRRDRALLATLAVGGFVVGVGRHTPVYGWLYAAVPGFRSFRSPGSFMFMTTVAAVGLAAMGAEAFAAWLGRRPGLSPAARRGALAGVLAVSAAVPWAHNYGRYIWFDPLPPFRAYLNQPVYAAAKKVARESGAAATRLREPNALAMPGLPQAVGTLGGYHPVVLARWERFVSRYAAGAADDGLARRMGVDLAITRDATPPAGGVWTALGDYGSAPRNTLWRRAEMATAASADPREARPATPVAPGWKAFDPATGRRMDVIAVDSVLLGARRPGAVFRYQPFSYRLGLFVSLAAACALGLAAWRGRDCAERNRPA